MRHAIATLILAIAAAALWWYWSSGRRQPERSANATQSAPHQPPTTPGRSTQIALRRGYFDPIELILAIDPYEDF